MAEEKKCPRCAELIKTDARACRHCGHDIDRSNGRTLGIVLAIGIGLYAISRISVEDLAEATVELEEAAAASSAPIKIKMERFSWENSGDRYCYANAKLTNQSDREVKFLKITLQFLKNGELVGSEDAYADVQYLQPGGSSTWDAMYRCPGGKAEVDITAVSQGKAVQVLQ